MTIEHLLILLTSFVATLLSSMSGGGANIISMPIFLALGVPFQLAITMMLVNSVFWVLPAAYNYLRNYPSTSSENNHEKRRKIDWPFLLIFSTIGLAGAYLGVFLVTGLDQRTFEVLFGAVVVSLVAFTYFNKGLGLRERKIASRPRQFLAYPFAFPMGAYEVIFGAGNGIMFAILTFFTRGFDFVSALGHYYAIAFPWALFSAYLLVRQGYFNAGLMTVAVLGALVGAVVGSRYARYKGNRFIKMLFITVGGILGLKLLLGF